MPCKMYSCCIVNWPIAMYCAAVNSAYNMPCTPENFQNDLLFGFSLLLRNFNILLIPQNKVLFFRLGVTHPTFVTRGDLPPPLDATDVGSIHTSSLHMLTRTDAGRPSHGWGNEAEIFIKAILGGK